LIETSRGELSLADGAHIPKDYCSADARREWRFAAFAAPHNLAG
jgi:hypothetical protein